MMDQDRQRDMLMAQINNKRALRQKYLRQQEQPAEGTGNALAELVMTNVLFLAIREKTDIFGVLRQLRETADTSGDTLFGTVMGWVQSLAEALDHSVYELFVEDIPKRRRILEKLLRDLASCDGWENIRLDQQGNGGFALPGFDYAYRMAERPSATLVFERTATAADAFRYTLTLGDGRAGGLIPGQGMLWQETQGPLQAFTDRVLAELNSGWPALQAQFDQVSRQLAAEAEKLRDLAALLEEAPEMRPGPLLEKEAAALKVLRQREAAAYAQMPEAMRASGRGKRVQATQILLGGAIGQLERLAEAPQQPVAEQLSEIAYMLENAGEPV